MNDLVDMKSLSAPGTRASAQEQPLVSIGMPVFNGAQYIGQALDSLLAQTHRNIELTISDDQSTDGTYEICSSYAKLDTRISLIRQPYRLGMWDNFQFVFDRSRGDYFMWASQDDVWDPEWIKSNLRMLSDDVIVSFGSFCTIDEAGNRIHAFPERVFSSRPLVRTLQVMYSEMTGVLMYGLFRRERLATAIGFAQLKYSKLYADNLLLFKVALAGEVRSGRSAVMFKRIRSAEQDSPDETSPSKWRRATPRRVVLGVLEAARSCGYYFKLDVPPLVRAVILANTGPFLLFLLFIEWRGSIYGHRNIRLRRLS